MGNGNPIALVVGPDGPENPRPGERGRLNTVWATRTVTDLHPVRAF
jgi:hypothetical protein